MQTTLQRKLENNSSSHIYSQEKYNHFTHSHTNTKKCLSHERVCSISLLLVKIEEILETVWVEGDRREEGERNRRCMRCATHIRASANSGPTWLSLIDTFSRIQSFVSHNHSHSSASTAILKKPQERRATIDFVRIQQCQRSHSNQIVSTLKGFDDIFIKLLQAASIKEAYNGSNFCQLLLVQQCKVSIHCCGD
jgi:hypothetical protein